MKHRKSRNLRACLLLHESAARESAGHAPVSTQATRNAVPDPSCWPDLSEVGLGGIPEWPEPHRRTENVRSRNEFPAPTAESPKETTLPRPGSLDATKRPAWRCP